MIPVVSLLGEVWAGRARVSFIELHKRMRIAGSTT